MRDAITRAAARRNAAAGFGLAFTVGLVFSTNSEAWAFGRGRRRPPTRTVQLAPAQVAQPTPVPGTIIGSVHLPPKLAVDTNSQRIGPQSYLVPDDSGPVTAVVRRLPQQVPAGLTERDVLSCCTSDTKTPPINVLADSHVIKQRAFPSLSATITKHPDDGFWAKLGWLLVGTALIAAAIAICVASAGTATPAIIAALMAGGLTATEASFLAAAITMGILGTGVVLDVAAAQALLNDPSKVKSMPVMYYDSSAAPIVVPIDKSKITASSALVNMEGHADEHDLLKNTLKAWDIKAESSQIPYDWMEIAPLDPGTNQKVITQTPQVTPGPGGSQDDPPAGLEATASVPLSRRYREQDVANFMQPSGVAGTETTTRDETSSQCRWFLEVPVTRKVVLDYHPDTTAALKVTHYSGQSLQQASLETTSQTQFGTITTSTYTPQSTLVNYHHVSTISFTTDVLHLTGCHIGYPHWNDYCDGSVTNNETITLTIPQDESYHDRTTPSSPEVTTSRQAYQLPIKHWVAHQINGVQYDETQDTSYYEQPAPGAVAPPSSWGSPQVSFIGPDGQVHPEGSAADSPEAWQYTAADTGLNVPVACQGQNGGGTTTGGGSAGGSLSRVARAASAVALAPAKRLEAAYSGEIGQGQRAAQVPQVMLQRTIARANHVVAQAPASSAQRSDPLRVLRLKLMGKGADRLSLTNQGGGPQLIVSQAQGDLLFSWVDQSTGQSCQARIARGKSQSSDADTCSIKVDSLASDGLSGRFELHGGTGSSAAAENAAGGHASAGHAAGVGSSGEGRGAGDRPVVKGSGAKGTGRRGRSISAP